MRLFEEIWAKYSQNLPFRSKYNADSQIETKPGPTDELLQTKPIAKFSQKALTLQSTFYLNFRERQTISTNIDSIAIKYWYYCFILRPPPHPHVLERDWTPGRIGMDGSHAVKAWESTTLDCKTSAFATSRLSLTRSAPPIDARLARERNKTQKTVLQKKYL